MARCAMIKEVRIGQVVREACTFEGCRVPAIVTGSLILITTLRQLSCLLHSAIMKFYQSASNECIDFSTRRRQSFTHFVLLGVSPLSGVTHTRLAHSSNSLWVPTAFSL